MTNETFTVLTEEDKNTKLKVVIRNRTENRLTDSELSAILRGISLNRQYTVRVSTNPDEFRTRLVLADASSRTVLGGIIAGMPGTTEYFFRDNGVCAYISKSDVENINIYIPKERMEGVLAYE